MFDLDWFCQETDREDSGREVSSGSGSVFVPALGDIVSAFSSQVARCVMSPRRGSYSYSPWKSNERWCPLGTRAVHKLSGCNLIFKSLWTFYLETKWKILFVWWPGSMDSLFIIRTLGLARLPLAFQLIWIEIYILHILCVCVCVHVYYNIHLSTFNVI